MTAYYEIVDRFLEAGDCNAILYAPVADGMTYRETRRYSFTIDGGGEELDAFVRATLLDPVSQELHGGGKPALEGFAFLLDYGMKAGALDLEKEAVLSYYRGLDAPGFTLTDLKIERRLYLFAESGISADSTVFIRDICNPAIHIWTVTDARDCA
jgi:hypothetical protein